MSGGRVEVNAVQAAMLRRANQWDDEIYVELGAEPDEEAE